MISRNAPVSRLRLTGVLMAVGAALPLLPVPAQAQDTAPAIESIRQSDLRADLFFLAGDELRGRLAGSPEGRVASAFIKSRFERMGLKPVGAGGSYYHNSMFCADRGGREQPAGSRGRGVLLSRTRVRTSIRCGRAGAGTAGGEVVLPVRDSAPDWARRLRGRLGQDPLIVAHEPGESDPEARSTGS